jgi:serine/threonine-protein kinase HipA
MNETGKVFYKDHFAGIITETNDGEYIFQYDDQVRKDHPKDFITFTMPVTNKPYTEKRLFPFFEGLIPEGWLLDIASENWKINKMTAWDYFWPVVRIVSVQ